MKPASLVLDRARLVYAPTRSGAGGGIHVDSALHIAPTHYDLTSPGRTPPVTGRTAPAARPARDKRTAHLVTPSLPPSLPTSQTLTRPRSMRKQDGRKIKGPLWAGWVSEEDEEDVPGGRALMCHRPAAGRIHGAGRVLITTARGRHRLTSGQSDRHTLRRFRVHSNRRPESSRDIVYTTL